MRVIQPTAERLRERRAELLNDVRMGRAELEERAEAGLLSGEEYWLWEEIRSIEFLLGGADDGGRPA